MELMKYSKAFALAAVFSLVTACGGDTNVAEDVAEDVVAEAEEVHSSDLAEVENLQDEAQEQKNALAPRITTIYFDFDKSTIRSEFYDVLNGHAIYLKANTSAQVKLIGHTDERGTPEYNMALGERRGNSVQDYLVQKKGVAASQIEVISKGEMELVSEDHDKNRRVEFKY